jgi:4-hydroxybenzoate polyprenyltransferase
VRSSQWSLISPRVHGLVDYVFVIALLIGPFAAGFSGRPRDDLAMLAGSVFTVALFTNYPLGLFKRIPFPAHGIIDVVFSIAIIAAPWARGYSGHHPARNFCLGLGAFGLFVVLLTDFRDSKASRS